MVNLNMIYIKKTFSNQLESDETDSFQQRIEGCMAVVDRGCPSSNDVSDYFFAELFNLYRRATDPEMPELVNFFRNRQSIP